MPLIQTSTQTVPLYQLHFLNPQRYPFILETTACPEQGQHYDILFAFPKQSLVLRDMHTLYWQGDNVEKHCASADFLTEFDHAWQCHGQVDQQVDSPLPFTQGWFVFLAYELVGQIESHLNLPNPDASLPVAFATRITNVIIYDHLTGHLHLVAEDQWHMQQLLADLAVAEKTNADASVERQDAHVIQEQPAADYLKAVKKIKDYIYDGDVFQVNLSRKWSASYAGDVDQCALYTALRQSNPAPFFGLAQFQDTTIYSSSPERLVRVKSGHVETRPIAGTRPRLGQDPSEDATKRELAQHPKERAEHIMLIDLERNDLGRICVPGTVHVDEMMVVESYAHVHHIVSNIGGELRSGTTPGDVVRALFPGGTITGCPKVRCMEIIAELEKCARGAYTGSMGYIADTGDLDLNILIRTLISHQRQVDFRAGAGIVADSDPQRELEETRAKAQGLLLAITPEQS